VSKNQRLDEIRLDSFPSSAGKNLQFHFDRYSFRWKKLRSLFMLNLTKNEKTSLVIFVSILLAALILEYAAHTKPNSQYFDYSVSDSIFTVRSADTVASEKDFNLQNTTPTGSMPEQPAKPKRQKSKKKISPININEANSEQLCSLPGIGPATAKRIIEYRKNNGNFTKIDDLIQIKGIGSKKLAKIKPYVLIKNSR
jgi:comEA protein